MAFQKSPATTTQTRDGQPVDIRADYTTRTVSVYVAGEYQGTWGNRDAAKVALGLVDVAKKAR